MNGQFWQDISIRFSLQEQKQTSEVRNNLTDLSLKHICYRMRSESIITSFGTAPPAHSSHTMPPLHVSRRTQLIGSVYGNTPLPMAQEITHMCNPCHTK